MKKTQVLVEGALATAIFIILLLASFYLPFIGIVGMFCLPIPIIFYTSKRGLKSGILSVLVSGVLALLFTNLIAAVVALGVLLPGLAMGTILNRKKSAFAVLAAGSLTLAAIFVLLYGIFTMFFDINPAQFFSDKMNAYINMASDMSPVLNGEAEDKLTTLKDQIKIMISTLIPALIVIMAAFYALIIALISTPVLKRLGVSYPKWPPFREWRFPRSLIWYYLAALILMLFGGLHEGSTIYIICLNVYYVLEMAMVIQGVSFIFFFCHIKNLNKSIPVIITIIGIIIPLLLSLIRILGIIDIGFGLRNRMRKS